MGHRGVRHAELASFRCHGSHVVSSRATREALVAFLQGGHTAVQPAKVTRMCIAGANDDCRVAMQGGWPAAPSLLASDLR